MDVQRYISSGIIESYVAGLATDLEVRELQAAIAQSPEVKAAADAVQLDMERYVQFFSVAPPPAVKERLFQLLDQEGGEAVIPAGADETAPAYALPEEEPAKAASPARIWRFVAAAAILGLIASVAFNVIYFNSTNEWKDKYQALLTEQNKMVAQNDASQARLQHAEGMLQQMRNPDMKMVRMYTASKERPNLLATVYWNTKSKEVMLTVNNLPEPAPDRQYQLWAIVNGVPVDAGVFDMGDIAKGFQKMKTFEGNPQMFAVTLEKKGGNPTPTLTQMYLAGKVSS